jgi:putative Holliday junction resolvase
MSGTLLAFDFGEKRIGVAMGESTLKMAHPLTTIHATRNDTRLRAIADLVAEWRPVQFVVGLPMHLDGAEHAMTARCRGFAKQLEGRFRLPTTLVDERLTSAEAHSMLRGFGRGGKKDKALIDQLAAQRILQAYFDGHATA